MGLIAQDVLSVVPEVVLHDESTNLYSLCYGNLTALLVEAIKDLETRHREQIEELRVRLTDLEHSIQLKKNETK